MPGLCQVHGGEYVMETHKKSVTLELRALVLDCGVASEEVLGSHLLTFPWGPSDAGGI